MYDLRKLSLFLLIVAVLLPGIIAADTWYNNYNSALDDIDDGNWSAAIEKLQLAISEKPGPKLKTKTTGLRFIDYIPYYYLGIAYYNKADWSNARDAFRKSARYSAVRSKTAEYTDLSRKLDECENKLKPVETKTVKQTTPKESVSAVKIRRHISSADGFIGKRDYKSAKSELDSAKALIVASGEEKNRLQSVNSKLNTVNRILKTEELMSRANNLVSSSKYREADKIVEQLLVLDPGNPDATSLRRKIRSEISREEKTAQIDTGPEKLPERKIPSTRDEIAQAIREADAAHKNGDLLTARRKLTGVLQIDTNNTLARSKLENVNYTISIRSINEGIASYFDGELEQCRNQLGEALESLGEGSEHRAKLIVIHQFMAVSYAEEYYKTGASNPELLEKVQAHIEKIKSLDKEFQIEAEYFAPKIVSLFNS